MNFNKCVYDIETIDHMVDTGITSMDLSAGPGGGILVYIGKIAEPGIDDNTFIYNGIYYSYTDIKAMMGPDYHDRLHGLIYGVVFSITQCTDFNSDPSRRVTYMIYTKNVYFNVYIIPPKDIDVYPEGLLYTSCRLDRQYCYYFKNSSYKSVKNEAKPYRPIVRCVKRIVDKYLRWL